MKISSPRCTFTAVGKVRRARKPSDTNAGRQRSPREVTSTGKGEFGRAMRQTDADENGADLICFAAQQGSALEGEEGSRRATTSAGFRDLSESASLMEEPSPGLRSSQTSVKAHRRALWLERADERSERGVRQGCSSGPSSSTRRLCDQPTHRE